MNDWLYHRPQDEEYRQFILIGIHSSDPNEIYNVVNAML
jgi:hypothetical protein